MSDWTRKLLPNGSEINVAPPRQRGNWSGAPAVRLYGESSGITALQIRGALATPTHPPAYAHARLRDSDLVALRDAIDAHIKERGIDVRRARIDLAAETVDE